MLIEIVIKLNNKLYKLVIEIYYSKTKSLVRLYFRYASYFSKKI